MRKQKKSLAIFGYAKPNRYSWAILMGYLENQKEITNKYDFLPLSSQIYEIEEHPKAIEQLNRINWNDYDKIILLFSLMTIQMDLLKLNWNKTLTYFKKKHDVVITIVGGPHAQARPKELAEMGFNFIIPFEGEIALKEILIALEKVNNNFNEINVNSYHGIAKGFPNFVPAKQTMPIELDETPPYSKKYRLFGPIEISRGCPFRCKYCATGHLTGTMRHASIDKVVEWVKEAVKIKFDKVWFLSPNSFAYGAPFGTKPNPKALETLLQGLSKIKGLKKIFFGTFPSEVRPDFITKETLEAVIPYISNKYFALGAQNASDRMLKQISRGHNFQDVLNAIRLLKKKGFMAYIDFIFGLPGETEEDILLNLEFLNKVLDGTYSNVKIRAHTFMPLPGTVYENEPKGKLDPRIIAVIGQLATQGKAEGEYLAQAGKVKTRFTKKNKH